MLISDAKASSCWRVFVVAIFATQILLGLYVYKTKADIHHEYLKEVRKDVWVEEIRRILSDPEFCLSKSNKKDIEKSKSDLLIDELKRTKRRTIDKFMDTYLTTEDIYDQYCINVRKCNETHTQDVVKLLRVSELVVAEPQRSPGTKGEEGIEGPPGTQGAVKNPELPETSGLQSSPGVDGPPALKGEPEPSGRPRNKSSPGLQSPSGHCKPCPDGHKIDLPKITSIKYGDYKFPGFPPRSDACVLTSIQEPVFLRIQLYKNDQYGAWMVDSDPPTEDDAGRFWVTTSDNHKLFEHDETVHGSNQPLKIYDLYTGFKGTKHVIYKGWFFYEAAHSNPRIIRYGLRDQTSLVLDIPGLTIANSNPLYSHSNNYLDFSVDENGLWIIFGVPNSTNTGVLKVDSDTMIIESMINITLDRGTFEEMFVASGILYGVNILYEGGFKIEQAFDLYTESPVGVDLFFRQDKLMIMATYNPLDKQLIIWDNGNLAAYPVVCEPRTLK